MGSYINPGNEGFARILAGEYVDKTGLIGLVNDVINTTSAMVCVSRPRRFGKSFAAESLVAYYCYGCDSHDLFDGLSVSEHPAYDDHINAYNVVHLDMTEFTGSVGAEVTPAVSRALLTAVRKLFPEAGAEQAGQHNELTAAFLDAVEATGRKFVFVIDEWDAPFREAAGDTAAQERYVKFLRLLFKTATFTPKAVAAAYITGILPIKRYGTQSAMTDFNEYTMVRPFKYAPYVGFTSDEVARLCRRHGLDMDDMRCWYDGYELPGVGHVYAPFSVMRACENGCVDAYWTSSDTFEMLRSYIEMNFDGLQNDVAVLLGGDSLRIDPQTFQNDMASVRDGNEVLTLLVHLGYLAYDEGDQSVRIPNEEVRREFVRAVEGSSHPRLVEAVQESVRLLESLVAGDEEAVAAGIQRVHDSQAAPLYYSDEQALRAVVKTALFAAVDEYARVEELPSGHGFADVAYIPRRGSSLPALLVELKWDKPADSALAQIRRNDYPQVLRDLGVPIVVAGVVYDSKTKEHHCKIEMLG